MAEHIPTEGPEGVLIEGLMEAMAEYYSRQLSQNYVGHVSGFDKLDANADNNFSETVYTVRAGYAK